MYLIIFEDGDIQKTPDLTDELYGEWASGIVTLINITDTKKPTILSGDHKFLTSWDQIENFEQD